MFENRLTRVAETGFVLPQTAFDFRGVEDVAAAEFESVGRTRCPLLGVLKCGFPFLGRVGPPELLPLPRDLPSVSGLTFALAAALITSATKEHGCRPRPPRSRMRRGRGRKSEASSRLMPPMSPRAITKTTQDRAAAHCRQKKQGFGGDGAARCPKRFELSIPDSSSGEAASPAQQDRGRPHEP